MRKGFTLLELVIVVIIVAVLAGLGIPQFIKTVERAKAAEGVSILGTFRTSQLRYYAEYGVYTSVIGSLDVGQPASLKNFVTLTANIPAAIPGTVAQITRSGSLYTLQVTDTGSLSCTSGSATCPAGF